MASLPPQQLQRRQTPPQQSTERTDSQAPSATSIDSETVLLNDKTPTVQKESPSSQSQPQQAAESEPRKCWICFSDETEDTPESSVWRTPCPCNLTAHEACLLDWIADIESPEGTNATASPKEIRCPQCKAEIHLTRPRSYIAEAAGAVNKVNAKLLIPAALAGASYTIFLAFSHHGVHTIEAIFGHRDARRILRPLTLEEMNEFELSLLYHFPRLAEPLLDGWRGLRIELGLPLIPLCLIASRSTLADAVLPILPVVFFATHSESSETLKMGYWPPSAALTLVLLPYVRSAYEYYMDKAWGEREKQWLREVQPRFAQQADEADENGEEEEGAEPRRGGVELQIGIEVDVEEEGPEQVEEIAYEEVPGENAEQGQEQAGEGLQEGQENAEQPAAQEEPEQPRVHRQEFDLIRTGALVADTVFGALLFPSICAMSGGALKLVLPTAWTRSPLSGPPKGLLQTRWGRSIIGGCLFVVLKDALRIYVRWRMAASYRERRVRDWDKKTGKLI